MGCEIKINVPGYEYRLIPYGRGIVVAGEIFSNEVLPEDTTFRCELRSKDNEVVRYTTTSVKADTRIDDTNADLTLYPSYIDPDKKEYRNSGFVELMCRDLDNVQATIKKASIKAYYNDTRFRTVLYGATNTNCGAIFDDGQNWLDDNDEPFLSIERGSYVITVTLTDNKGSIIASDSIDITVGDYTDTLICRFNPTEHKKRMIEWAQSMGFAIAKDPIPGYLDPYHNDLWLYHMGLLPFYRASDIAMYCHGKVHMFVYEIAQDSTSYSTELAYLMSQNDVDNHDRFEAYCYDCGEAVVGEGRTFEKIGHIIPFGEEYLHIYRIDIVTDDAEENLYNLDSSQVIDALYDDFEIKRKSRIAITGVVKPYQLCSKDFILKPDNTFEINNYMDKVIYTFYMEKMADNTRVFERKLNMDRYYNKPLEKSVYEFYNIFEIDDSYKTGEWFVDISVTDAYGRKTPCTKTIKINIK